MQSLLALLPLVRWPFVSSGWRRLGQFVAVALPLCFLPSLVVVQGAYTWSLLVFAVPSVLVILSLRRHGKLARLQGPLAVSWALLVPMGVALNLLFADDFFHYPNRSAVCGLVLPTLDLGGLNWQRPIPLEELAFYVLGFLCMLLTYAWIDECVVPMHRRAFGGRPAWTDALLVPSAFATAGCVVADSLPAYWLYLCAVPLPPTLVLWPVVNSQLNRRALGLTCAVVVAASAVWEAALAVPRGWWAYQPESLLGRFALGLPWEAMVVWFLAPVTTAVLYEFVRLKWRRA